jgi:phytoene desaturase
MQSAWLRPHNRSEEFSNLYFVGAGTHPGAGVPAVLASGKIAANLIQAEAEMQAARTSTYRAAVAKSPLTIPGQE